MEIEGKQLNILLVEDNDNDCELLTYQFRKAGYQLLCHKVDTEQAFRQALDTTPWHVVLCDHNLPDFDLPTAINILNQTGLDIPLIIVSGDIPDTEMVEAMKAGAKDFIRKGDFARLLPVIERELKDMSIREGLSKAKENINRLVNYDASTGLPNREHLLENMRMMIASGADGIEFSLVLLRLNHLPQSNNFTVGGSLYKELIRTVARRINTLLTEDAYVVGNNCLATIITGIRPKGLEDSLKELIELFSQPFTLDGQIVFTDCSVGVSAYPESGSSAEEMLLSSETALEYTNAHDAAPLCIYAPEMKATLDERQRLEVDIHRALPRNEFFILFQPQVDIQSREIIGVEALLRWRHPELGVVSPIKFIPLLERTGLIMPVGEWVIKESCRQGKLWFDELDKPIKVAVNLSVEQFYKSGLITSVEQALKESGLPARYLELEITENIAICHEEATLKIMSRLKAMGISLSIDDFGTGYSSLAYLQSYPIDLLKIDQSFVRPIQCPVSRKADMLRAIIALAQNLNLNVLAEGIETEEQADFVLQSGCPTGQGYLFAKPMEAHLIIAAIENTRSHAMLTGNG